MFLSLTPSYINETGPFDIAKHEIMYNPSRLRDVNV